MERLLESGYMSIVIILAVVWTVFWKGMSLWKAARNGSAIWFFFLLILNTLGILDIAYIFIFSERGRANAARNNQQPRA